MTVDLDLFRSLFINAADAYATPGANGTPTAIREPLSDEILKKHLDGKARILAYFVDAEGFGSAICIDIDENNPDLARRVAQEFEHLGFDPWVEASKSKGFHVWVLTERVPAGALRDIGLHVAQKAGAPGLEVFPKQAQRTDGGLGNGVWLPLFGADVHRGKTVFLNRGNGLTPYPDQNDVLTGIVRASLETIGAAQAASEATLGKAEYRKKEPVPNAIPVGQRRDTLTRIAGANRRLGLGEGEIYPILAEVNRTRCDPPVLDKDVRAIAKSITRYKPEEKAPPQAAENTARAPLFESLAAMLATPRKPVWLVKHLVETPSTNLIFGPSGSGKSFVAVDLAGAVATGGTWMGRAVTPGPVFYIAGEGRVGLLRRFTAWQIQRLIKIPPDRLFLSTARIELNLVGAAEVEKEVARRAEATGEPPALIVIDTLARAMPSGGDENSTKDMMAFVNIVDQLRDRFRCAAFIVHHAGVADDKRARGSTSLKAAMDAELCITERPGGRTAEWTKVKDLPKEPKPEGFVLERVLLGADDDGESITSATVTWQGRTAARATIAMTKTETFGLETLRSAITAGGEPVSLEAWRLIFYSKHWGESTDAKKMAFKRTREGLAAKGFIAVRDDNYSILNPRNSGT